MKTLCRHKRTNTVWLHLREVPRIGKFRVTERTEAAPGWDSSSWVWGVTVYHSAIEKSCYLGWFKILGLPWWLRICLAVQLTPVWSLIWGMPTSVQWLSYVLQPLKPAHPRAEPTARGHWNEKPEHRSQRGAPCLAATRENLHAARTIQHSQKRSSGNEKIKVLKWIVLMVAYHLCVLNGIELYT